MHSLVYLFTHSLVYLSAPRLLASSLICSFIGPACLPGQEAFLPDDRLPPAAFWTFSVWCSSTSSLRHPNVMIDKDLGQPACDSHLVPPFVY